MHSRPELMVYTAGNDGSGALPCSGTTSRNSGQRVIASGGRLDVQRHPVQANKEIGQPPWIGSCGMQSDFESECPNLLNCIRQPALQGGFTAAEYHGPQQAPAPFKKIQNILPKHGFERPTLQQVPVLTIAAVPGAALAEDHGRELSRIVDGGERGDTTDNERLLNIEMCRHCAHPFYSGFRSTEDLAARASILNREAQNGTHGAPYATPLH